MKSYQYCQASGETVGNLSSKPVINTLANLFANCIASLKRLGYPNSFHFVWIKYHSHSQLYATSISHDLPSVLLIRSYFHFLHSINNTNNYNNFLN